MRDDTLAPRVRLMVGDAVWEILPRRSITSDGVRVGAYRLANPEGDGGEIFLTANAHDALVGRTLAGAIAHSFERQAVRNIPPPPPMAPVLHHDRHNLCLLCGRLFKRPGSIRKHFEDAHGVGNYAFTELIGVKSEFVFKPAAAPAVVFIFCPSPALVIRFTCWTCGRSYACIQRMTRHLVTAHVFDADNARSLCREACRECERRGKLGLHLGKAVSRG